MDGADTPNPIQSSNSPTLASTINTTTPTSDGNSAAAPRPSAWNQAGTWEEKDCTDWCKDRLKKKLLSTTTEIVSSLLAKISDVDELTGEGSVAIAGGKRRYIFDFHAKLSYEIFDRSGSDDSSPVAKGEVRIPDVCSTHYEDDELEIEFEGSWKKKPPSSSDMANFLAARTELAKALRSSVQSWVHEFNEHY